MYSIQFLRKGDSKNISKQGISYILQHFSRNPFSESPTRSKTFCKFIIKKSDKNHCCRPVECACRARVVQATRQACSMPRFVHGSAASVLHDDEWIFSFLLPFSAPFFLVVSAFLQSRYFFSSAARPDNEKKSKKKVYTHGTSGPICIARSHARPEACSRNLTADTTLILISCIIITHSHSLMHAQLEIVL